VVNLKWLLCEGVTMKKCSGFGLVLSMVSCLERDPILFLMESFILGELIFLSLRYVFRFWRSLVNGLTSFLSVEYKKGIGEDDGLMHFDLVRRGYLFILFVMSEFSDEIEWAILALLYFSFSV
jgi:hypothetical protein